MKEVLWEQVANLLHKEGHKTNEAKKENMKLYLFGSCHGSPICRKRYLSRIREMLRDSGYPAFVAVEAAPDIYKENILSQREKFRKMAIQDDKFNRYGSLFVDELAKCIVFEADAHMEVYGQDGPPVLWLDKHFDALEEYKKQANSLGLNNLIWFKNDLNGTHCNTMEEAFQRIHDRRNIKPSNIYDAYEGRDCKWSELLKAKVCECSTDAYAIAIVGLDHIAQDPLSVWSLLADTVRCEQIDLTK